MTIPKILLNTVIFSETHDEFELATKSFIINGSVGGFLFLNYHYDFDVAIIRRIYTGRGQEQLIKYLNWEQVFELITEQDVQAEILFNLNEILNVKTC